MRHITINKGLYLMTELAVKSPLLQHADAVSMGEMYKDSKDILRG
jgi:hypothetical protein